MYINGLTNTLTVERKVNMCHTILFKTVYRNGGYGELSI